MRYLLFFLVLYFFIRLIFRAFHPNRGSARDYRAAKPDESESGKRAYRRDEIVDAKFTEIPPGSGERGDDTPGR
jgi:hypothetical protein